MFRTLGILQNGYYVFIALANSIEQISNKTQTILELNGAIQEIDFSNLDDFSLNPPRNFNNILRSAMELQESRQEFNDLKAFATDNMPEIHELTQIGSLPLIVDIEPIQNALITIADLGIAVIPLAASLGSKFLTLIEKRNTLSHAKFEKSQAKEQVKDIQSILKIQKQAKNKFEITSIAF